MNSELRFKFEMHGLAGDGVGEFKDTGLEHEAGFGRHGVGMTTI